jgi:hypothetical protein
MAQPKWPTKLPHTFKGADGEAVFIGGTAQPSPRNEISVHSIYAVDSRI